MKTFERFDRLPALLPDLLVEIAAPHIPDYTDEVLAVTAATRQRPRWTFLERWLPVILSRQRLMAPMIPWRLLTALLAILALVAAGLFIAGSRPHVPPPFGPARNGAIVFDAGGDVFVRNNVDAQPTLVVGGPGDDFATGFTRDGRHITFLRRTAGTEGSSNERIDGFIANLDGSDPVDLTGPLIAPNWWDESPDGTVMVVHAVDAKLPEFLGDDNRSKLYVVDVRHPGSVRPIDLPLLSEMVPSFRGPDGSEIVFRGRELVGSDSESAIYAAHLDGTGLRRLTPLGNGNDDYLQPLLSPDGTFVTYTLWRAAVGGHEIHVRSLVTGEDRLVSDPMLDEGYGTFSPDNSRLTYVRYTDGHNQMMVLPLAAGSKPYAAGPNYSTVDGQYISGYFSPDGRYVDVNEPASGETRLVDAMTGGDGQLLPWASHGFGWQRLAP